ncbi:MAG: diguanylate cyclase [Candidatus Omnitrophica bacterium]|nr:diguanylate cyclase [Candidatus Omnitrophota bacterium]
MISLPFLPLKRRIWIAISLTTFIPLIIFLYYINEYVLEFPALVCLGFLVFLGWWIVFEVFRTITRVNLSSKKALEELGHQAPALPNEVESLESVISMLSVRVKNSFEQLKDFSKQTEELNREVSKKVVVLSTILQANELFSKETPPEEIVQFLLRRLQDSLGMKCCFCGLHSEISRRLQIVSCNGIDAVTVEDIFLEAQDYFNHLSKTIILSPGTPNDVPFDFQAKLMLQNIAFAPIISDKRIIGLIGIGNNSFSEAFNEDALDVLSLFSQNVALIWEHKRLSIKVENLEIFDSLTGLYNEKYIKARLEEEIQRSSAYQRPCGFMAMKIHFYHRYQKERGVIEAEKLLKKVAKIFKETLRPIDIIGRVSVDTLAAILIERNKRQSQEVANALGEKLKQIYKEEVTFLFSVVESPVDGVISKELQQAIKKQFEE